MGPVMWLVTIDKWLTLTQKFPGDNILYCGSDSVYSLWQAQPRLSQTPGRPGSEISSIASISDTFPCIIMSEFRFGPL